MANEPNNANTEERLKQYAASRRQRAPESIHPATRNLLQGEVRRVYGSSTGERRSLLRLRWLQALAWLAILAAVPLFLIPRNPPSPEKLEHAIPSKPNEVKLPAANAPAGAPIVLSDTKEPVRPPSVDGQQPTVVKTALPSSASAPVVSATPPTDGGAMASNLRRAKAEARDEARPAPTRALALDRESASKDISKKTDAIKEVVAESEVVNNLTLNFANTIPNQQVLSNFKLEQNGSRLKISEKDGSTYSGGVLTQLAGNDVFNVAGYNRTLNKSTIITGQVVRANLATAGRLQQQQQSLAGAAQSAQNNSFLNSTVNNNNLSNNSDDVRVQGNAIIGSRQYKVDAQVTPGP